MNIVVCIKPVPSQITINHNGEMIRNKTKNVINSLDRNALEEAIKIKEHNTGSITAISMGIKNATNVLKDALALGADKAILLNDIAFAGSDTNATSYILSSAMSKIKDYDLIMCGNHTSDSATGQVGIELATKLKIPFAINVVETKIVDKQTIECKSETDNGYLIVQLKLPALISVNKDINIPRIASISNILSANNKEVELLTAKDLDINTDLCGIKGSPTKVIKTEVLPSKVNNCIKIDGSPEEQAKEIVNIIKKNLIAEKNDTNTYFEEISDCSNNDIFVYCEVSNNKINQATLELLAKGNELSQKAKCNVSAVIINESEDLIKELFKYGASKVYYIKSKDTDYYTSAMKVVDLVKQYSPQIFLFGKSFNSKIIAAFVAATLDTGLAADCIDIDINDKNLLVQKRIVYGGMMVADIICPNKRPQMATIYGKVSNLIYNEDNNGPIVNYNGLNSYQSKIKIINVIKEQYDNMGKSNFIVGCGAGVQNKDTLTMIKLFTDKLGGIVGVSRKAADQGLLTYKNQIGLTGNNVKPNIYLACGISGASEHMIGVNSNIVIAINKDSNAPIFKYANYGVIGDVNKIIPLLIKEWEEK